MDAHVRTRGSVEGQARGSQAFKSLAKARLLALKRYLEGVRLEEGDVWGVGSRKADVLRRLRALVKATLSMLDDVRVPASVREPEIESEYDLPLVAEDVAQMLAMSGDAALMRYAERFALLSQELEDVV